MTVHDSLIGEQVSVYNAQDPKRLNEIILNLLKQSVAERLNMSPGQMVQITNDIKKDYWYFRVPEIALVLRKGLRGEFGNVPSGTHPVYYWFHQYDTGERNEYFEAEALKHKEGYEKSEEEGKRAETQRFDDEYKKQTRKLKAQQKAIEVNK